MAQYPGGYPPQAYPNPQPMWGPPPGHARPPMPAPPQQPQPQSAPQMPYIGARISLISNLNIRYEGTLYTIDPKEATIALQNVRCFGTENRPTDNPVEASLDIYEGITFRGKDIKDLYVCEPVRTASKPPQDPAIVSSTMQPVAAAPSPARPQGWVMTPQRPVQEHQREGEGQPRQQTPQSQPHQRQQTQTQHGHNQGQGQGQRQNRQQQQQHPRGRQQHGKGSQQDQKPASSGSGPAAPKAEEKEDFDFQQANARFNKDEFLSVLKQGELDHEQEGEEDGKQGENTTVSLASDLMKTLGISELPKVGPKYDKKKSFYDDLSTDRDERAGRPDLDKMRKVDSETFGDAASRYRPRGYHASGVARPREQGQNGGERHGGQGAERRGGRGRGGRRHGGRGRGGAPSGHWRGNSGSV